MKVKELIIDTKTGEKRTIEKEYPSETFIPKELDKGVDLQKLKQILLSKGIVDKKEDIEPSTTTTNH